MSNYWPLVGLGINAINLWPQLPRLAVWYFFCSNRFSKVTNKHWCYLVLSVQFSGRETVMEENSRDRAALRTGRRVDITSWTNHLKKKKASCTYGSLALSVLSAAVETAQIGASVSAGLPQDFVTVGKALRPLENLLAVQIPSSSLVNLNDCTRR